MVMRLTLGHVEGFDETIATFAQQLGLTSIQFHTPSDLSGRLDDKADLLANLLASENVSPERAVMIDDLAGDVVSARANGVRSIGVLWGYGSVSECALERLDELGELVLAGEGDLETARPDAHVPACQPGRRVGVLRDHPELLLAGERLLA